MPQPTRQFESRAGAVCIFESPGQACEAAADRIAAVLLSAARASRKAVLGLATGSTPIAVYKRLVEQHRHGALSFSHVHTYNLDEFYPISPTDPNSYRAYMQRHLFDHVGIPPNQTHVLDGTVPERAVAEHCQQFERWMEADGGLDLQLLGIGRNGHIGFNEPCDLPLEEALCLRTRLVSLHPVTTADAAKDFGGSQERVPRHALTLGVAPILAARSILILALGRNKTEAVARALEGNPNAELPASLLQTVAAKVRWYLDEEAAAALR